MDARPRAVDATVNAPVGVFITAYRMCYSVTYWNNENKTAIPTMVAIVPTNPTNPVNNTKAGRLSEWYWQIRSNKVIQC